MIELAVIFVQYDTGKYKDSFVSFKKIIDRIPCKITYIVVDNKQKSFIEKMEKNVIFIIGDNLDREFSGWQKGITYLHDHDIAYNAVLLANETVIFDGNNNFIKRHASLWIVLKAITFNAAIGDVCSSSTHGYRLFNYEIYGWLRSNCIILSRSAVRTLTNLVSLKEKEFSLLVPRTYKKTLVASFTISSNDMIENEFICSLHIDENDILGKEMIHLELDHEKEYVPINNGFLFKDYRRMCFRLKQCTFRGRELHSSEYESGWYREKGSITWSRIRARLEIKDNKAGELMIRGEIPEDIFNKHFEGKLSINIYSDSGYFLENSPISNEYRAYLIEFLSMGWHSKFRFSDNWNLFRDKTRAMLNEAILTGRLKEAKHPVLQYSLIKYADRFLRKIKKEVFNK